MVKIGLAKSGLELFEGSEVYGEQWHVSVPLIMCTRFRQLATVWMNGSTLLFKTTRLYVHFVNGACIIRCAPKWGMNCL